ncbi:MAG: dihydroorotate dehydrogenase electron transfer subunit [Anaerolineae bacterium]|nr:dihydroorotate dehydrogenase electron transfer subunit [Anaerolineae bacterium]
MQHTSDRGQLPRPYRVVEIREENPTVRSLCLEGTAMHSIAMVLEPGQFVMAWLPGVDEKPFSPSCAKPLTLTVTRVGPFTTAMHQLSVGDTVWLRGPFGRGFSLDRQPVSSQKEIMLVGGGCGAAPLLTLAQAARQAGQRVLVVLGARTTDGLFFQDRYTKLGCHVLVSTDDGSAGERATSVQVAASLLSRKDAAIDALYACGPGPMLDAVYELAQMHNLPVQLSYEAYMRCGIGVCGSCALGGCLVCRDGPVFQRPPDVIQRHPRTGNK